jgi:hypothetical protein
MLLNPQAVRFGAIAVTLVSSFAAQAQTPAPTGASVYFINLKNHATVTSTFKVQLDSPEWALRPPASRRRRPGIIIS